MKAVAYYRTSSKSGVGDDKDSETRQKAVVMRHADSNGIEIVKEFYDAGVQGADHLVDRKGFNALMDFVADNGIKVILIETVNRLARDVLVQLTGYKHLKKHDVTLVPVDDPKHFENIADNPMAEAIMIIMATLSMLDKKMLCKRMGSGREKKRRETGRCEGRKPALTEAIQLAKKLRSKGLTLRGIAIQLSKSGFRVRERDESGILITGAKIYNPQSIKVMLRSKDV